MIVTPAEAAEKWCPFAQVAVVRRPSWLRWGTYITNHGAEKPSLCCLGPRCMAWRWFEAESDGDKRRGFCGLAWRQ